MTLTESPERPKSASVPASSTPLRKRVLVAVLVVVSASVVVLAGLSVRDYGTPAFWAAPQRIDYCGREYHRNPGTVHGTPAEFVWQKRNVPNHWQRIGRTFALHPIYGTVLDKPFRAAPSPAGNLCAGNLWIKASGAGNWIRYEMSGGI